MATTRTRAAKKLSKKPSKKTSKKTAKKGSATNAKAPARPPATKPQATNRPKTTMAASANAMPSEPQIRPKPALVQALAAYLIETAQDKGVLNPKIAAEEAEHMVESWSIPETTSWSSATRATLRDARGAALQGKPILLACRIKSVGEQTLIDLAADGGMVRTEIAGATLLQTIDRRPEEIPTLPLLGARRIREFADEIGRPVQVLAVAVGVPRFVDPKDPGRIFTAQNRVPAVHVVDVRPVEAALDQVAATDAERREADETIEETLANGGTPLDYLYQALVDRYRIEPYPELETLIRAVIVQSMAVGYLGNNTAKLSIVAYGPPGTAKTRLMDMAADLNPSFSVLGARATAAGVTGATTKREGGWTIDPGPFQWAYDGVVGAQDCHKWTESDLKRSKLDGVLQMVLQDGYFAVTTSGAPGERIIVQTGLLADMNPPAKAGEGAFLGEDAIVSRLDTIVVIPEDHARDERVARRINESLNDQRVGTPRSDEWARPLRVLVAALRDRIPRVERSAEMSEKMDAVRAEATQRIFRDLAIHPRVVERLRRLPVSYFRWAAAHARACGRSFIQDADLSFGLRMIKAKLDWLRADVQGGSGIAPATGRDGLVAYIRSLASPAGLSVGEAAQGYEQVSQQRFSPETVVRAFNALRDSGEWHYSVNRKRWYPTARS